mmetsp:Transcript_31260/g.40085  ORF Transcript_31260/g.40085 Transcript_31260/m.40085 type:complete len:436 (+) Transcript_31260:106-1413(+)
MAWRQGLSVGHTTNASSLADQVKRFKPRGFREVKEVPRMGMMFRPSGEGNPAHEPLAAKCVRAVVEGFADRPTHEELPAENLRDITSKLPLELDPKIGALYVFDENYWKNRCIKMFGWPNCQIVEHGCTWKQLFFERHVQERLENYSSQDEPFENLLHHLQACQDYVFTLTSTQMLAHPDMEEIFLCFPNLMKLELEYGVKKIGLNYERMLFGMKISDAASLAKAFANTETLTTCILSSNLIDDDLLRMLMTGLIKNSTITHLDLSHNKITNHGARLLSKLLNEKSVIVSLNLSDNQIHAEGGRYLGRALRSNDSLMDLNLRLNRLTDDGGRMLLEGLRDNHSLSYLNLSGNSIAAEAVTALTILLRETQKTLVSLDLSCNELQDHEVRMIKTALEQNETLTSLDLRMNDITEDLEELEQIEKIIRANELNIRES